MSVHLKHMAEAQRDLSKPQKRAPRPRRRIARAKRPRRVRKTSRAKLGRMADKLFSLIVRTKPCAVHGDAPSLCSGAKQCAHKISRSYHSTRWDEDNALALCAGAHVYYTHHPLEWERLLLALMRHEDFDALKARALKPWDRDLEGVLVRLAARAVALGIKAEAK